MRINAITAGPPLTRHSDDPSLDSRLSFVRRQSGLDARAALFVLSPLSTAELNEFIERYSESLKRTRHSLTLFTHLASKRHCLNLP